MQRVMIRGKLPSLNEFVDACRGSAYKGAAMKKTFEQGIVWQLGRLRKIDEPIRAVFIWHEETKKRDKDNVAFAKKFILDAMQKAGKIPNDNNRYILGFEDIFIYDKEQGVEILIYGQSEIKTERLTDRAEAEKIKANIEGLMKAGIKPDTDDLRYVKLAEFENEQELRFGGKLRVKAMDKGVVEK